MSNYIHMLVLRTREGRLIQRADALSSVLETKAGGIILILANNVKVELVGETLASLMAKLHDCGGLPVILHDEDGAMGLMDLEAVAKEAAELEPA